MMETKHDDISGLSQPLVSAMNHEEGQQAMQRRPVGLTITVEKIDRALADVQAQIEYLRRYRINLGLGRVRVAGMEVKWKGE
jgi:hypothetical protein